MCNYIQTLPGWPAVVLKCTFSCVRKQITDRMWTGTCALIQLLLIRVGMDYVRHEVVTVNKLFSLKPSFQRLVGLHMCLLVEAWCGVLIAERILVYKWINYLLSGFIVQSDAEHRCLCTFHSAHVIKLEGVRRSLVGWGIALQAERSLVRFPMWSLGFFIDLILPAALWPWCRLSL
jgi:hypothetical protein